MNLSDLRSRIFSVADYAVETVDYKSQVDELINDALSNIWNKRLWNFAIKEKAINFHADLTSARVDAVTASVRDGHREITFSGPVRHLDRDYLWEGQIIEIQSREYTILKVVDNQNIHTKEPFRLTGSYGGTDWKIKQRYITMPGDCAELLYIGHKDYPYDRTTGASSLNTLGGKQIMISNVTEEGLGLRGNETATYADYVIPSPPRSLPPAQKFRLSSTDVVATPNGDIPGNFKTEIAWCYTNGEDVVGPLSEPFTVSFGALVGGDGFNATVNFVTTDDFNTNAFRIESPGFTKSRDTHPNQYEGLKKRTFFNSNFDHTTGKRLGLPCWREVTKIGAVLDQFDHEPKDIGDMTGSITLTHLQSMNGGNRRYDSYASSQYLRFRPFPRVDGFDVDYKYNNDVPTSLETFAEYYRPGIIRYYSKPNRLALSTDVPNMPDQFHQVIVYEALFEIFTKHNNLQLAQMYRKRADDAIRDLEKRYVNRTDTRIVKGMFGFDPYDRGLRYTDLQKDN